MPFFTNDMCLLSGHRDNDFQSVAPCRIYPLTKSQEGIWIEHQADPKSSKYHLVLCLDLSKHGDGNDPSIGEINDVIHAIADRHGITRSTIAAIGGKPHILEYPSDSVVQDIRIMVSETAIVPEQFVAEVTRRPFSLDKEFPVRWIVLKNSDSYMLIVIGHHIAMDGQSMSVLSSELMGRLKYPEADFAISSEFSKMHAIERAWTMSSNYAESKETMAGQVRTQNQTGWPVPVLPAEGSSLPYRKIDSWQTFPKSELEGWANMYGTSWFRVATALVGLVVANVTRPPLGQDEVLAVGFGGRPQEMGSTVGQFANALPVNVGFWDTLTTRGPQQGTFRELVKGIARNVSAVKKAQMLAPIEVAQACREFNIDYKPPRVAITYSPKLSDEKHRLFPVEGAWNLFFPFHEYESEVRCGLVYDPSIFSADAVKDIRSTFERLVSLSKQESVKLFEMLEWLPMYPSVPEPGMDINTAAINPLQHFHHFFDAHAQTRPTTLALDCQELGISMTYGELYSSTQLKAKGLLSRDVGRGDRVVIHLPRGFAVVEWIVAILKAGAAFIYLDPEYNQHQKSIILSDCQPKLVIDEDLAAELEYANKASGSSVEEASYHTADNDLAYMVYTSGSTGKPKGVMIEHGNVSAYARAIKDVYKTGFGGRVLQIATFSFDGSILELVASLCTGATLCFAQYPKELVGEYLGDVIKESRISFMHVTPTSLEALAMEGELPILRQISVGGEPPSRQLFVRWNPYVDLVNAYGPTETTVVVAGNKIDRLSEIPETMSVGRPNRGSNIYICTEDLKIISRAGVIGEVCIAGAQVGRGYNGISHEASRNFTSDSQGTRWYRSGDRGMYMEDGSLVITGRIDRELKIRGFRISPEEIEEAILDAGLGVTEVSVQPTEDGTGLLAFLSPATVSIPDLVAILKDHLPSQKIPSQFVPLGSLPVNRNGKTDHKTVKETRSGLLQSFYRSKEEPSVGRPREDIKSFSEHEVAANEKAAHVEDTTVETVKQIWQQVIGVSSPLSSNVNFFDIGGHSLHVPKLHKKLKESFPGTKIRVTDLFHQSTIEQQAALCHTHQKKNKAAGFDSLTPSTMGSTSTSPSPIPSLASSFIPVPTPNTVLDQDEIAVVGIAGRFPGAQDADTFYTKLLQDYLAIIDSSKDGHKRDTLPGNIWVPKAGVLDNIEEFDPAFWHLSEEEATEMDPQQRLFLDVAYEALTDAGYFHQNDETMVKTQERIGLFIGCANNAYHLHTESVASDPFLRENRGFVAPSISARTAYHLNLTGPNATIQTSCSSGTVALSMACDAIRLGRCDTAVVGGVSVQLFDGGYVTRQGQIFSPRGECNPFDARADGTVPSDGVVAVVLKRYSLAVKDSTPVYAKILGTSTGSDGALEKAGYQVPSPRGQAEVIKSAWKIAGVSPKNLVYAEIHGSGTPFGDALELEGLSLAMEELGNQNHRFVVGSTKGNIGNTQQASGLVSLIKLCKSMQGGVVPRTRGFEIPNETISPDLPIDLASKPTNVGPGDILVVSATGWGGVNSHTVLAFPDEHLHKRTTRRVPAGRFNRRTFAAPRLSTKEGSAVVN
ncbi:hypothetical protein LZL87_011200 [Fusarium oxysporum]|nr:hypothetical protein LZL87_011200 [Fusarium oxysporum]